jgi:prepilin-type N-terminal cleavage/methylation domain-containing protein
VVTIYKCEDIHNFIHDHRSSGFTLVELIVVVAIISLLAVTLIPRVGGLTDRAKVAKVLAVYDSLKMACDLHYADTSRYAYELLPTYSGASYHQLSQNQGYGGWNGPYIDGPITFSDNPTKGWPAVSDNLDRWYCGGFDLDRDDIAERSGAGNFLHFERFPESLAQEIDAQVDGPGPGNWRTTGKVEWHSHWGGTIQIYMCGGV